MGLGAHVSGAVGSPGGTDEVMSPGPSREKAKRKILCGEGLYRKACVLGFEVGSCVPSEVNLLPFSKVTHSGIWGCMEAMGGMIMVIAAFLGGCA